MKEQLYDFFTVLAMFEDTPHAHQSGCVPSDGPSGESLLCSMSYRVTLEQNSQRCPRRSTDSQFWLRDAEWIALNLPEQLLEEAGCQESKCNWRTVFLPNPIQISNANPHQRDSSILTTLTMMAYLLIWFAVLLQAVYVAPATTLNLWSRIGWERVKAAV